MGTLIKFELRKILGNKAGMVACVLALLLLAALAVVNLASMTTRDIVTGEVVEGFEAQATFHKALDSHAGPLDDEHVAQDAAVFDQANSLARETAGLSDLSNQEIIDTYGSEFWSKTRGVLEQGYYMELIGTLESTQPRATSLEEGIRARINGELDAGFEGSSPYGEAERAYWTGKLDAVSSPIEYGYAEGWHNVLSWMSFSSLAIVAACIALSGTFAGEYQERTASVVLPTRRGKRALPAAKVISAFIFMTLYWWICALVEIGVNVAFCGADGWELPLQVVLGFDNPYALSVGQAVLALYGIGYLIALGMLALTLFLSAKMRSTMPVAVTPMAITFLGMLGLFITPIVKIVSLTPLAGLNYAFDRMLSYAAGPVVLDLPAMLVALYVIMLVVLTPLAMRAFKRHQVA